MRAPYSLLTVTLDQILLCTEETAVATCPRNIKQFSLHPFYLALFLGDTALSVSLVTAGLFWLKYENFVSPLLFRLYLKSNLD